MLTLDEELCEVVYVLTNPAMPGLVRIGVAVNLSKTLMRFSDSLDTSEPYKVSHRFVVRDKEIAETYLRRAIKGRRVDPNKDFYRMEPEQIPPIFDRMCETIRLLKPREPVKPDQYPFHYVQIPTGSKLRLVDDPRIEAVVYNFHLVKYNGAEMTTFKAARLGLEYIGSSVKNPKGPIHWTYEGETLADRKKRYDKFCADCIAA